MPVLPQKVSPTVISLFSGCGGSSLGYRLAGYRELYAVDWDKTAGTSFQKNFPDVKLYLGDIKELPSEKILKETGLSKGGLDVLDGSPPCQGFSTAKGKRRLDDDRNFLFKEYFRIVEGLQPRALVAENVVGLTTGPMKVVFAYIVKCLEDLGYNVNCMVLNSANYGVPQLRRRLIWIGYRKDINEFPVYPMPSKTPVTVNGILDGCPEGKKEKLSPKLEMLWYRTKPGQKMGTSTHLFSWVKVNPNFPSPTITAFRCLAHWAEPRFLTIPEIKRCHSYPDGFILEGNQLEQWKQVGNSVPPLMMKAIADKVKEAL